jgi:Myb-like DNA-binding domain
MSEPGSASLKVPLKLENNLWMVPCKLDPITKKFIPVCDGQNCDLKSPQKYDWTEEEDKLLESLILFKGSRKWTNIADKINQVFHDGKNLRLGKNCRERWVNHLDPSLKKGEWTPEEDQIILANQARIGNKWSAITKLIPGRTENQVKNRWKSILRKASKCIKNEIGSIQVEWGGEVGTGSGFDSEEIINIEFEKTPTLNCYMQENQDMNFDYLDSPSYFYN